MRQTFLMTCFLVFLSGNNATHNLIGNFGERKKKHEIDKQKENRNISSNKTFLKPQ